MDSNQKYYYSLLSRNISNAITEKNIIMNENLINNYQKKIKEMKLFNKESEKSIINYKKKQITYIKTLIDSFNKLTIEQRECIKNTLINDYKDIIDLNTINNLFLDLESDINHLSL